MKFTMFLTFFMWFYFSTWNNFSFFAVVNNTNFGGRKFFFPKETARNGRPLRSARKISMSCAQMEKDATSKSLQTVLVMQMGQFIDHDITHTPNHGVTCCNKNGTFPSKDHFL